MVKVGLISDTHGYLDPKVYAFFKDCDEIWHAGDIGDIEIINKLQEFKPSRFVYGNIDEPKIQHITSEILFFEIENKKILIIHIAGSLPKYNPNTTKFINMYKPDMLVCGHSHILKVMFDKMNNLLYVNPGAAGNHGFHKMKTIIKFDIDQNQFKNMQIMELGLRGKI